MQLDRRFAPIPHELTFSEKLTAIEKALYQLIVAASFRHGYAYFSVSYAAKVLHVRRSRVIKAANFLEHKGWIVMMKEYGQTTKYIPFDEFGQTIYAIGNEKIRVFFGFKGEEN